MVQEFHVVRCFSCQSFQVQQVKKVNKWSCKLCGEKQSLLKEYGRGSGADCRRHVQKLNSMRGVMIEEQERNAWSLWEQVEAEEQEDNQVTQTQVSRWGKYLDTPKEGESEEQEELEWNVLMDRQQCNGNSMTDRKRKRMAERTDRREDSCIPDQPTCLKRKPQRPSVTNSPPSKDASPPSKDASPPSKDASPPSKNASPPSVSGGPASRWARFLSTDCQVQVAEGSSMGGWNQCVGGTTAMSRPDIPKPHHLLPVSSMFESGEEFSFDDDDFLTCQRV